MNNAWLWDRKISDAKARTALKDPGSKSFYMLAALLLSRMNDPKEVFKKYLDPLIFCKNWAVIKRRMRQDKWSEPRIVFWQVIYEKLSERYRDKGIGFRERSHRVSDPVCRDAGKAISALRHEQGISQKDLACRMGVSQQLVSRIEKGGENLSLITLSTVARALDRRIKVDFVV